MSERYYESFLYRYSGLFLLIQMLVLSLFPAFIFPFFFHLPSSLVPILTFLLLIFYPIFYLIMSFITFNLPGNILKSSGIVSYEIDAEGITGYWLFDLMKKRIDFKDIKEIWMLEYTYSFRKKMWPISKDELNSLYLGFSRFFSDYELFKGKFLESYKVYCIRNKIKPEIKISTSAWGVFNMRNYEGKIK